MKREEEITEEIHSTKPTELSTTNETAYENTDSIIATSNQMTKTTTAEPTTTEPNTTVKSLQPSAPNGK